MIDSAGNAAGAVADLADERSAIEINGCSGVFRQFTAGDGRVVLAEEDAAVERHPGMNGDAFGLAGVPQELERGFLRLKIAAVDADAGAAGVRLPGRGAAVDGDAAHRAHRTVEEIEGASALHQNSGLSRGGGLHTAGGIDHRVVALHRRDVHSQTVLQKKGSLHRDRRLGAEGGDGVAHQIQLQAVSRRNLQRAASKIQVAGQPNPCIRMIGIVHQCLKLGGCPCGLKPGIQVLGRGLKADLGAVGADGCIAGERPPLGRCAAEIDDLGA